MEYSKTVGYHHHHHHCNQFICLDIVDNDSMLLMMVVLFRSRVCNFCPCFYWMAYSGKGGVKCGGQSETGRVELGD